MAEIELETLVGQASSGSALAVDALLSRYLPSVRAYLRLRAGRLLLDKESVSDLAQSVCRDVLENIGRFRYDGEDGFRRWLFVTAQRKIADRYEHYLAAKRSAPAPADGADLDKTLACYRSLHTPSRHAIAREELQRLEKAIASLPEAQQDVVILAKVAGLSHRAIAAQLDRSEEAVRMLLHRGLARLSDLLVEE